MSKRYGKSHGEGGRYVTGPVTTTTVGASEVPILAGDGRACTVRISCVFPALATLVDNVQIRASVMGAAQTLAVLSPDSPSAVMTLEDTGDAILAQLRAIASIAGCTVNANVVYWMPEDM